MSSSLLPRLDAHTFGPWAVITGASSGIGRAIARHVAASGIGVVLVARREDQLRRVGEDIARDFSVGFRIVKADLTRPDFFAQLEAATSDLEPGLAAGNAGCASPGEFLKIDREELLRAVRIKVDANLVLVHHFGNKLATRGRGGILLISSISGLAGVPYVANTAGVEAYVFNLGGGRRGGRARRGGRRAGRGPGPART